LCGIKDERMWTKKSRTLRQGRAVVSALCLSSCIPFALAREFPVHVKLEDWYDENFDNDDIDSYVKDLLIQSGGAGVGLGIVVSAIMFVCMILFWCCPCCGFHECCLCCRKETPKWKETTNRRIGYALLIFSLLISACGLGILYPSTVLALDQGDEAMTNVATNVRSGMEFLCGDPLTSALIDDGAEYDAYAAGKTAVEMCGQTQTSVSAYLTDTSCKTNATLQSIEDYIDSLDEILDALNVAKDAFTNTSGALSEWNRTVYGIDDAGVNLSTAVVDLNAYTQSLTTGLGASVPTLSNVDDPNVRVPSSANDAFSDGLARVNDGETQIQNAYDEATTTISTDLKTETRATLEDSKADITSEIEDLQLDILDFMDDASNIRHDIEEARVDYYGENRDYVLAGYLTFYGISVVFLVIALIGFARRSTCCVQCGGCCIFLTFAWLCTFLGLVVLAWLFVGDACDNVFVGNAKSDYKGLFEVNLANETVEFGNVTIDLETTVETVLTCGSGCVDIPSACGDLPRQNATNTGCDATNNLVDIFALGQDFNFTSEVSSAVDEIRGYAPQLDYSAQLDDAKAQLESDDVNALLNFDITKNVSGYDELSSYSQNLTALQESVPVCRGENACDDADLTTDECNRWLALWTVTSGNCNCVYLQDESIDFSPSSFYEENCVLVNKIASISASANQVNASVNTATTAQGLVNAAVDTIVPALDVLDAVIVAKRELLLQQADLLVTFASYVQEEAPGHFQCSWISGAWTQTVENDVCTKGHETLQNLIAGMSLCVFGMLVGFFAMMDLANPHRMEPRRLSRMGEDGDSGRGGGGRGSVDVPAHNWEHPLAHPEGSVDPETGRIRLAVETPRTPKDKKYWTRRASSTPHANATAAVDAPYADVTTVAVATASGEPVHVTGLATEESNIYGL